MTGLGCRGGGEIDQSGHVFLMAHGYTNVGAMEAVLEGKDYIS